MKIGLVRHFKVNYKTPFFSVLTTQEVKEWFAGYDACSNLQLKPEIFYEGWDHTYSSPLIRAKLTAQRIQRKKIEIREELREINPLDLLPENRKNLFFFWALTCKKLSTSEPTLISNFDKNIDKFLDDILKDEHKNILIVSHYFTMYSLQKSLLKRGFKGPMNNSRGFGKLYVYEKD